MNNVVFFCIILAMRKFLVTIWWIGVIPFGLFMLGMELALIGEWVNPVMAWVLVMILGIPFAIVLPLFAYLTYGSLSAAMFVIKWWFFSILYMIIGTALMSDRR